MRVTRWLFNQRPEREESIAAVLRSNAPKKLVVGGPGTGKTYLFTEYLKAKGTTLETGLVLTFIKNLVGDLEKALSTYAKVQTFHSYGKSLLHKLPVVGISANFDYYPPLVELIAADLSLYSGRRSKEIQQQLESDIRTNTDSSAIQDFLEHANYYDAAGHDDGVYRVVRHLSAKGDYHFRWAQLVVDEVQDFNALEMALIELIAARTPILAAGDDDQALYGFKKASPDYIRAMRSSGYTVFTLPYCSRCPRVVVAAANDVIQRAIQNGKLVGRIPKLYLCHERSKRADSEAHPKIIAAYCSTSTPAAPYISRYVLRQIEAIPNDEVRESWRDGYPTALVIGRKHFLSEVYGLIRQRYGNNASYPESKQAGISVVDGYKRILTRPESNLGWRILLHVDPCAGKDAVIRKAFRDKLGLAGLLPEHYAKKHRHVVAIIAKVMNGDPLTETEAAALKDAVKMDMETLRRALGLIEEAQPTLDETEPSIVITSFLGAKGLSAGHVFIIGLLDGQLPKRPEQIIDDEICKFVVALTRTRKQCYLVTSTRHRGKPSQPSIFLSWILRERMQRINVDKHYFEQGHSLAS